MWNSTKSLTLSIVCTYILIVFLIMLSVLLPFLHNTDLFSGTYIYKNDNFISIAPFLYASSIVELVILLTLRKLLLNIKKQDIFTKQNVKLLRIISWLCFAAGLILALGGFQSLTLLFVGVVAGFFGLIIRVVKNVIAAAVELKDDVDYTI